MHSGSKHVHMQKQSEGKETNHHKYPIGNRALRKQVHPVNRGHDGLGTFVKRAIDKRVAAAWLTEWCYNATKKRHAVIYFIFKKEEKYFFDSSHWPKRLLQVPHSTKTFLVNCGSWISSLLPRKRTRTKKEGENTFLLE